jgi:hypothetical protein
MRGFLLCTSFCDPEGWLKGHEALCEVAKNNQ